MGNHHDNNHSNEKKPVSFAVPFYMAVTTLVIIFALVSLGDPCNEKCCEKGEKCEKECVKPGEKSEHGSTAAEEKPKEGEASKKEEPAAHGH